MTKESKPSEMPETFHIANVSTGFPIYEIVTSDNKLGVEYIRTDPASDKPADDDVERDLEYLHRWYREQKCPSYELVERIKGYVRAATAPKQSYMVDAAYKERNQVVAALAKCFPSGTSETAIEGWDKAWHGCVYIDLPTGQVSWHYHESQAYLFADLPPYQHNWDGHDTPEKYRRVNTITAAQSKMRKPYAVMLEDLVDQCMEGWVGDNYLDAYDNVRKTLQYVHRKYPNGTVFIKEVE